MKNYIIIGVSLILALIIYFYNPYSDYLGVYNKEATITLEQNETDYEWVLVKSNDNISLDEINNNEWKITINKKGTTTIDALFMNLNNSHTKYKIKYTLKNNGKKIFWVAGEATGLSDFLDLK